MQSVGLVTVNADPLGPAFTRHARSAWPVSWQVVGFSRLREALPPERKLGLQLRALQPVAMPFGEIPIADGKRGEVRLACGQTCGIELAQLDIEQIKRPAIPDDVVRHEEQNVIVAVELEHACTEQRCPGQIERRVGQCLQALQQHRFALISRYCAEVLGRKQMEVDAFLNHLHHRATFVMDGGTQDRLTLDHVGERTIECGLIKGAAQPMGRGRVVGDPARMQLLQQPQTLLHQR